MTYKVVQRGTGNLGALAVQSILNHPDLELIGTWVSSREKAGRDVGELSRVPPIGVLATQDAGALIASVADCICYAANSIGREEEVLDDCIRMLRAGKNVVNVSDPALVYPKAKGGDVYDRLHEACLAGNTSFYTSGGDPGWAGFGLALAPLTVAQQVRSIRLFEIYNWTSATPPCRPHRRRHAGHQCHSGGLRSGARCRHLPGPAAAWCARPARTSVDMRNTDFRTRPVVRQLVERGDGVRGLLRAKLLAQQQCSGKRPRGADHGQIEERADA